MNRIIRFIFIATGSLFILSSCSEDFLNTNPKGIAGGDVMATPEGVEALLIGSYSSLFGVYGSGCVMWEAGSLPSDDMYKGEVKGHPIYDIEIETWQLLTNNRIAGAIWMTRYDGISRANDVLVNLKIAQASGKSIPEQRAIEIEAEAKFLRAYYHFDLRRVYEKIPYIKTQEEMGGKNPEEIPNDVEVWDEIESDLQFAIDNLPLTSPKGEAGRADRFAAKAIKARVHLFQQEFSDAKILLDEIIQSGNFALVDNYYDNYRITTENNKESIFEIQCNVGYGNGTTNTLQISGPTFHQRGSAGVGWGYGSPSQNIFEAYQVTPDGLPILDIENREPLISDMGIESSEVYLPTNHLIDPRVDWTIARRGIPFLDWGIHLGKEWIREQAGNGTFMMKKWMHYKSEGEAGLATSNNFKNAKNYRSYRYAHILLWRAEVAVEDGDLDNARQLVNMIRERAKNEEVMGYCSTFQFDGSPIQVDYNQPAANYLVEPYPANAVAFSSKENALKAVRLETRLEFASEGMRFYDLRRWDIDNETLNYFAQHDYVVNTQLTGVSYDPEADDYWPIPQNQVDLQKGVLTQDPAYQ
jgi:starch-binding outer membrane protein, SusD/RagB family